TLKPEAFRLAAIVAFIVTLACVGAPVGYLLIGSFRTGAPGAPGNGFTFENWIAVYATARYQSALLNTVSLCTVVAALSLALGGLLAWILARTDAPGRRQLAVLMVVPLMISNL